LYRICTTECDFCKSPLPLVDLPRARYIDRERRVVRG
jgi:hypothetical protein